MRSGRSVSQDELRPIRDAIENFKPDVVFNLLEEFHGEAFYDQQRRELSRAACACPIPAAIRAA